MKIILVIMAECGSVSIGCFGLIVGFGSFGGEYRFIGCDLASFGGSFSEFGCIMAEFVR